MEDIRECLHFEVWIRHGDIARRIRAQPCQMYQISHSSPSIRLPYQFLGQ